MTQTLEVLSSTFVEQHLNRNPRVLAFCGTDVLSVDYDTSVPVTRIIAAEARELGLDELAKYPLA